MNPNVCEKRGCFIRKENSKFIVVDYPTWTYNKYGIFTEKQNSPIKGEFEKTFESEADALNFCAEENYIVCHNPYSKQVIVKNNVENDNLENDSF